MIFVHPIATVNQAKYRDLQERHSTPYCAVKKEGNGVKVLGLDVSACEIQL